MPESPEPHNEDMSREALQAEVERLRWLLDANPQVPWSADAEGNITDFSQRWLDLTGLTREQALGGGWVAAPHPDDVPLMVKAWTRSIATGEPYDVRHRLRVADGSHRWMHTWAIARRDAAGKILAWFGSTEDVHDAAVQTERLYATADALPALVFHVDTDLVYRFANKSVEATFGRPRSEILGRTIGELVGEATYAAVLPHLQRALAGERAEWAMWIDFPSGRRFTRATYVPSLDAGGEVVGIDVLAVDETETRITEEALRASEARQRFLVELGQATAEVEGAEETMLVASRMLGRHLGVSRCGYALLEEDQDTFAIPGGHNEGVKPIVGKFRLSSFGAEVAARLQAGEALVVRDVAESFPSGESRAAFESIQVRAMAVMPLVRGGRLVALMSVDHLEPRAWSPEEVELVRTVAERAWALVERVRAEQALRRSAETFESLVRNSPFGVYVVDADFRLSLVSQGAQRVFHSVRPLVGRDFAEVLRAIWEEPFASEAIGIFRRVLETGEPYHSPRTVESRLDVDAVESYDWRVERIVMPDGRLAAVCHFYDLSERVAHELALRQSDERFRAAIGAIGVLWTNSPEGRMEGDQPGWASLTGQSREEYEGFGWASAVHPEDARPTIDAWNEAVRGRGTFVFEHRVRRHDGVWRRYAARAVPVLDPLGEVREWVGVHADVTELRSAEEALRAGEARLRLALETARLGTWDHDVQTGITHYSAGVGPMFGRGPEPISLSPEELLPYVHPEDRDRVASAIRANLERGEPYAVRIRVLGDDGTTRWVEAKGELERDAQGVPFRVRGVSLDVTEQAQAEQALRDANERLERAVAERTSELTRANRDLDQFAYSVAHDLRAPLRAIVSTSRILAEDEGERLTREGSAALDRQVASALRLAKIVDDLLGFARLADAEPKKVSFDMTTLARRVAEEVASRRSGCAVAVQEGMRAVGDPSLVGYVLTNLLDNACKFSPGGGVVTVGDQDDAFYVRDQGLGFDPRHAHKLFVAFERLVGQEIEGSGVGLANVRRIVEKHGGRVWAESEPGKGATFWFTLGEP